MHYYLNLLIFCSWTSGGLMAQTFSPLPAALLSQELALQQANECYIYFDNPSGDSLQLRWRQLELQLPADWDADLCDYGLCYAGIPSNGWMNPVYDSIQPYLKLIIQPGATAGSAWAWFRVFEANDENNFADVFFSLYTAGVTGTHNTGAATLRAFPNPTSDFLMVENTGAKEQSVRLMDTNGQIFWQGNLLADASLRIPVNQWPTGFYILHTAESFYRILISH